jgi:tetratricopeptide (TPR) repeat protein
MDSKKLSLILRIMIAVAVGFYFVHYLFDDFAGKLNEADYLFALIGIGAYSALLCVLFGVPFMRHVGERFGQFYTPSDESFRIMPQYSKAEGRLKAGDYPAAIREYREVIDQFPNDIFAHIQIAQIAADKINDLAMAEAELLTATAMASTPDAIIMAHNRLADFYQFKKENVPRAIEVIEEIRTKLPDQRADHRAEERIAALQKIVAGGGAVPPSPKIAFRQAGDDSLQKRRGY